MSGGEPGEEPHPHFEDNTAVFVVRVWQEPAARSPYTVRGVIEHLASGHRRFFSEIGALNAFIYTFAPGLVAADAHIPGNKPCGLLARLHRLLPHTSGRRRD